MSNEDRFWLCQYIGLGVETPGERELRHMFADSKARAQDFKEQQELNDKLKKSGVVYHRGKLYNTKTLKEL